MLYEEKVFLLSLIAALLCTNITAYAQENTIAEKETIVYNEECRISTIAATDIQSITISQVGTQIIPTSPFKEDLVQNAEVIYRFTYKVTAKRVNGQAVTNMPIQAFAYTGPIKGYKFTSIDSSGAGYIDIDVRGAKNFTLYCILPNSAVKSNKISTTPTVRANYQSTFYCTGYITVVESEYSGAVASAAGIPGATFKAKFLDAVKINGSGKANSGKFLHYDDITCKFSYLNPTTATGTTPIKGKTIAVDPYYIPRAKVNGIWRRATVSIANIGTRVAEDGGGGIKQYRIDVYNGLGKSGMTGWVNANRSVTLVSVD